MLTCTTISYTLQKYNIYICFMYDTVVYVSIVQISNTCAPARMCSGINVCQCTCELCTCVRNLDNRYIHYSIIHEANMCSGVHVCQCTCVGHWRKCVGHWHTCWALAHMLWKLVNSDHYSITYKENVYF